MRSILLVLVLAGTVESYCLLRGVSLAESRNKFMCINRSCGGVRSATSLPITTHLYSVPEKGGDCEGATSSDVGPDYAVVVAIVMLFLGLNLGPFPWEQHLISSPQQSQMDPNFLLDS